MEYTLEQFENEFEVASFDKKVEILNKALDTFDIDIPEVKEVLLKYKDDIQDLRAQMAEEENLKCVKDIESGILELFTCIKEFGNFNVGQNYYVKIDDVKSLYSDSQLAEMSNEVKSYINNIKPVIWLYGDNGIGSLKFRTVFVGNFSEHFQKYEK